MANDGSVLIGVAVVPRIDWIDRDLGLPVPIFMDSLSTISVGLLNLAVSNETVEHGCHWGARR